MLRCIRGVLPDAAIACFCLCGGTIRRKGIDLLLQAYVDTFSAR